MSCTKSHGITEGSTLLHVCRHANYFSQFGHARVRLMQHLAKFLTTTFCTTIVAVAKTGAELCRSTLPAICGSYTTQMPEQLCRIKICNSCLAELELFHLLFHVFDFTF